jgi:hypothetical protein
LIYNRDIDMTAISWLLKEVKQILWKNRFSLKIFNKLRQKFFGVSSQNSLETFKFWKFRNYLKNCKTKRKKMLTIPPSAKPRYRRTVMTWAHSVEVALLVPHSLKYFLTINIHFMHIERRSLEIYFSDYLR